MEEINKITDYQCERRYTFIKGSRLKTILDTQKISFENLFSKEEIFNFVANLVSQRKLKVSIEFQSSQKNNFQEINIYQAISNEIVNIDYQIIKETNYLMQNYSQVDENPNQKYLVKEELLNAINSITYYDSEAKYKKIIYTYGEILKTIRSIALQRNFFSKYCNSLSAFKSFDLLFNENVILFGTDFILSSNLIPIYTYCFNTC